MQFLYHPDSGSPSILLEDEYFRYLIKARREKSGADIYTRNLKDDILFHYRLDDVGRRNATLTLQDSRTLSRRGGELHLGWCVIDPKVVEKTLPMLNQMGVGKITFITCDFSQKNFRLSPERLEKILINSCEQSGRSDLLDVAFCTDVETFLAGHPECAVLDFDPTDSLESTAVRTLLVGCEGGFSDSERRAFTGHPILSFRQELILKSETAALAACSKILL